MISQQYLLILGGGHTHTKSLGHVLFQLFLFQSLERWTSWNLES